MSEATPRLTRRAMLGGAALAGAGVLIRPPIGRTAGLEGESVFSPRRGRGLESPDVFSLRVGALSGESAAIRPRHQFVLAGVQWSLPGSARIELRTRLDGGRWSAWAFASAQGHAPDGPSAEEARFGEPVWSGGADQIQLRSSRSVVG